MLFWSTRCRMNACSDNKDYPAVDPLLFRCDECFAVFPTRNQLFSHLNVHGAINVKVPDKFERVACLVGWISSAEVDNNEWIKDGNLLHEWSDGTNEVSNEVFRAVWAVENMTDVESNKSRRFTRCSSCSGRASFLCAQEDTCHALSDVICMQVRWHGL